MDWDAAKRVHADPRSVEARVFCGLRHIFARRAAAREFHGRNSTEILDTHNDALFAFARRAPAGSVVCVFNFSERWTALSCDWARTQGVTAFEDILSGGSVGDGQGMIPLPPYARVWLR
jgi:amylosucrase